MNTILIEIKAITLKIFLIPYTSKEKVAPILNSKTER